MDGGCWMVWRECPPSTIGRLGGASKSYSSFTVIDVPVPEPVRVSPERSRDQEQRPTDGNINYCTENLSEGWSQDAKLA